MTEETMESSPGVDRAYDFVIPSYTWSIDRWNAANERLQNIQTYAATVILSIPIAAAAIVDSPDVRSPYLAAGIVTFVVIILIGSLARSYGTITVISSEVHYKDWLKLSDYQFKRDAIKWAGTHNEHNRRKINCKGYTADCLTIAFVIEVSLLLVWALTQS